MQRSSHLIDRSMASFILSASGDVVAMTSSSCIIMSEPMVFWREMECSGVSNLEAVNQGVAQKPLIYCLHWNPIVWAKKAYTLFGDLGELQQADHLESIVTIVRSERAVRLSKQKTRSFQKKKGKDSTRILTHRCPSGCCHSTLAGHVPLRFLRASPDLA